MYFENRKRFSEQNDGRERSGEVSLVSAGLWNALANYSKRMELLLFGYSAICVRIISQGFQRVSERGGFRLTRVLMMFRAKTGNDWLIQRGFKNVQYDTTVSDV